MRGPLPAARGPSVRLARAARLTAAVLATAGALGTAGWLSGHPALAAPITGAPPLEPVGALSLLLGGLALWLRMRPASGRGRRAGRLLAGALALLAIGRLLETALEADVGIGSMFPSAAAGGGPVQRLPPQGALAFLLAALGLLALRAPPTHDAAQVEDEPVGAEAGPLHHVDLPPPWRAAARDRLLQSAAFGTMLIALLSVIGHTYRVLPASGGAASPMSLAVAIGLLMLATGLLCAGPPEGLLAPLLRPGPAGAIVRRLLPAIVAAPLALGWLTMHGPASGLFDDPGDAFAVVVAASVLLAALLLWRGARLIGRLDAAREAAFVELQRSNAALDATVAQRTAALAEANRRLERENAERRRTAAALATLADASRALAASLDPEQAARRLAEHLVPSVADWCTIHLLPDAQAVAQIAAQAETQAATRSGMQAALRNEPRAGTPDHASVVTRHADPAREAALRALATRLAPERIEGHPVRRVIENGEPLLFERLAPGEYAAGAVDGEHRRLRTEVGACSMIVVPLTARGRTFGALMLALAGVVEQRERQHYDAHDLRFAEDLGKRAALAFDAARLTRDLQRAVERLQDADTRKDEFLAMLAHELRNPLAPLRNAAGLLRRIGAGEARMTATADLVARQVEHLSRLVDDLLDVSRITHGKLALRLERLDLRDPVRHAVEATRPLIDARGQALVVRLPESPVAIDGDSVRLAQVVANLLNNAAKYTEPGGHVELACELDGAGGRVRVRDDGMGIAPELLARLFEPFVQGTRTLDRSEGGLGIGLALSRRLVQLHGGTLEAASDGPGHGSEFTVRLPLAR